MGETASADIRAQIRAFSLAKAEGPDREIIQAFYAAFDSANDRFWGGELQPVPILVTPPVSVRAYADAGEFSAFGCRQQMRIRPSVARGKHNATKKPSARPFWRMRQQHAFADRLRWLDELVLHEMVHLWLNQIDHPGRHEHHGHGQAFTNECNRIGAMLGLPPVKARRRTGDLKSLPVSPQWPHCCRPDGEYGRFYGSLWEQVRAVEINDDTVAALCAAWEDATPDERGRFAKRHDDALAVMIGVREIIDGQTAIIRDLEERNEALEDELLADVVMCDTASRDGAQ